MAKAMSIFGMVVAAILLLAFGVDPLLGIPFGGANKVMDIAFAICAAILGYMSYDAFRSAG
ncbi:hypothetical protein Pla108_21030 [Botrimarina colliarenosi]|uniref:Uncharacterized protein n=1 Tax=Botrimarina colliarenosi TaxID=2528001 RepID=A0A5C6AF54_9BACT|nr:hypothetical protein [Botrimarina colliarenosi]TWT97948.1 hypothetical protein Pla108_21030 [Botrimarina colliarenosi]